MRVIAGSALAQDYNPGAHCIAVENAAGFPTVLPFIVGIADRETGETKLWFRVTTVSATVFAGSAEGPDTPASAGDLVCIPEVRSYSKRFTFTKQW